MFIYLEILPGIAIAIQTAGFDSITTVESSARRIRMKKALRYILFTAGMVSVLFFCVSATAAISSTQTMVNHSFSEPINLIVLGFGLIGFGSFIKSSLSR